MAEAVDVFAGKRENDANMEDLWKLTDATKSLAERNRSKAREAAPVTELPENLPAQRVAKKSTVPVLDILRQLRGCLQRAKCHEPRRPDHMSYRMTPLRG